MSKECNVEYPSCFCSKNRNRKGIWVQEYLHKVCGTKKELFDWRHWADGVAVNQEPSGGVGFHRL